MIALSSKLYSFCEELMRLISLNILLIVFSLPVVTAGGAIVATMEAIRHPTTPLIRTYITCFKANFLKSLMVMGFSLCSYMFVKQLTLTINGLPFSIIINFLIMSLLLTYNLNCYLLANVLKEQGIKFFRQAFYFTLGTFHKTFFFSLLGIGLTLLLSIVLGLFMFLVLFSSLIYLYVKLVTKELNQIQNDLFEDRA